MSLPECAGLTALDTQRLQEALTLAEQAIGLSDPNPRVGCVIGHADGRVLGRGHTQQAGGPHAEVMALRDAAAAGADTHGATAWVTLEPCAHHGRTPPCTDALRAAGIARVVASVGDPHPSVAGRGFAQLRAAGMAVVVADGAIAAAARDLNIGFFSRVQRGRPWLRLKAAASLDGRTALPDGRSQWITGPAARADGHAWRRRAGAVLTGIGTVLADDPRLDVRLVSTARQPLRAVLDSALRLPSIARLLQTPGLVIYNCADASGLAARQLREQGAEPVTVPAVGGRPDIAAVLADLGTRGVNELHVEAGAVLNGALLEARWVDELLLYLAPTLLGPGAPIAHLASLASLDTAQRWQLVELERCGDDLRLRARSGQKP